MDSDSEKNLLLQAKLFLQSLFLIDVIDIDDPKPIEKLSYDRVFAKRAELPKKTWVIYNEEVFVSNEIKEIQYAINDIDKFEPLPKYLIHQPFYNAAKGYILYLEKKLSNTQNAKEASNKNAGRPPKQKREFTEFLYCSEEDKKKVINVMNEQFKTNGPVGIVYTCIALMSKSYFKRPKYKAELWDALKLLLGDISTYSNLNKMFSDKLGDKVAETKSDIEEVKKKLP